MSFHGIENSILHFGAYIRNCRMKEKTLLKLSLIFSVLGIIILLLISSNLKIDTKSIEKIEQEEIGNTIKVIGKIERITDMEKVMFITLAQQKTETVSVILFKDANITIPEGSYVEITGTLDDYEGKKEIIADKIRMI